MTTKMNTLNARQSGKTAAFLNIPTGQKIVAIIPTKHTAHTLVNTIKWLRADPENRKVKPSDYFADAMTLDQFMAWFRRKLDEKISSHTPTLGKRKLDDDWQRTTGHLARAVNSRQVVRVGQVPAEFRAKLAQRISGPDDF